MCMRQGFGFQGAIGFPIDNARDFVYSEHMDELLSRITMEPGKCAGRPCIRGMRIRVMDILDMLAAGMSHEEILADFPYLEKEDIIASLTFASRRMDFTRLAS